MMTPPTKTITVVGVGALGSHFLQFSRNLPVTFRIIDDGKIKAKSVQAQFHSKSLLNQPKAIALKQTMSFLFGPQPSIIAFTSRLTSLNDTQLLGCSDLIVDCLDNGDSRRVVQKFVRQHKIPCLHGALAANGEYGRVVWDDLFAIDNENVVGAPTCEDAAHLPFLVLTSAWLARAAQEFILTGRRRGYAVAPTGTVAV